GLAANLIGAAGGDARRAADGVKGELDKLPKVEGAGAGQVYLGAETAKVFEQAEQLAAKQGDSFVTAETLLLAIALAPATAAGRVLKDSGVTPQKLNAAIRDFRKGRAATSERAEDSYEALK